MKAIAIEGVRKFKTVDLSEPTKDGQKVIIAVKKCGICGSDLHYFQSGGPVDLVMGHEFAGEVIDPGDRTDLKAGDRVTALPISPCGECEACLSGNPQYCPHTWEKAVGLSIENPGGLTSTIAVRSDMVYKLAEGMSFEEGAMVEPMSVGYHAVNLVDIKLTDDVLVIGGGIIGLSAAMFAKKQAHKVFLSETNSLRGQQAETLQVADKWINPTEEISLDNLKVKEGFDVVIECVGNDKAVNSAINLVKPGGTIILVGVALDAIPVYTVQAVLKELTIKGAIAYTKEEFASCIDLIGNKEIDVAKFIDSIVSLDGVQNAYERLTSGNDKAVKILVDPNIVEETPAAAPAEPTPAPTEDAATIEPTSTPVEDTATVEPAPILEGNTGGIFDTSLTAEPAAINNEAPAPAEMVADPTIEAPKTEAPAPVETVEAPAAEPTPEAAATPVETVEAPKIEEVPVEEGPVETLDEVPAAEPTPEAADSDSKSDFVIKKNIETDIIGIFDN